MALVHRRVPAVSGAGVETQSRLPPGPGDSESDDLGDVDEWCGPPAPSRKRRARRCSTGTTMRSPGRSSSASIGRQVNALSSSSPERAARWPVAARARETVRRQPARGPSTSGRRLQVVDRLRGLAPHPLTDRDEGHLDDLGGARRPLAKRASISGAEDGRSTSSVTPRSIRRVRSDEAGHATGPALRRHRHRSRGGTGRPADRRAEPARSAPMRPASGSAVPARRRAAEASSSTGRLAVRARHASGETSRPVVPRSLRRSRAGQHAPGDVAGLAVDGPSACPSCTTTAAAAGDRGTGRAAARAG